MSTKLVVGTAQLSASYGVFPTDPRTKAGESARIVSAIADLPLRGVDTAPSYGDAEALLADVPHSVAVFTKLDVPASATDSIAGSLRRLGRTSVEVAFLHDAVALTDDRLLDDAHALVGTAYARLGVSTYSIREFELALADERIGAIQAPVSVADQRLLDAGLLAEARRRDCLVLARSVFLQGALLGQPERLPSHLRPLESLVVRLDELSRTSGRSRRDLACAFVRDLADIGGVVIGCETEQQLRDNVALVQTDPLPVAVRDAIGDAPRLAESVVDPTHWR